MARLTVGAQLTLNLASGSPYLMGLTLGVGQGPTQLVLGPRDGQVPFTLADVVSGVGDMLGIPELKQVSSLASSAPWSEIFAVQIAPYLTVAVGGTGGPAGAVQLVIKLYKGGTYGVSLGGPVGGVITISPSFTVFDLIVGYESGKGLDVRARVRFDEQARPAELAAGTLPALGAGAAADPAPAGKTQIVSYPFPMPPAGGSNFQVKYLGLGQRFGPPPYTGSGDPLVEIFNQLESTFTSSDPATLLSQLANYYDPARGWFIGAHVLLRGWEVRALFNDPSIYGLQVACSVDQFKGLAFEILYQKLGPHLGVYYAAVTLPEQFRQINVGVVALTLPSFRIWIYTNGDFKVSVGWPMGPDSIGVQAYIFTGGGGFYFARLRSGDNPQSGQKALAAGASMAPAPGAPAMVQQYNPIIEFGLALWLGVGRSFSQGPFSASLSLTLQGTFQGILAWNAPDGDPARTSSISRAPDYYWFAATVSLVGQLQGSVDLKVISISVLVRLSVSASVAFETGYNTVIGVEARVDVEARVKIVFFTISVGFHATVSQSFAVTSGNPADASVSGPQNEAFQGMNDWVAAPALLSLAAVQAPAPRRPPAVRPHPDRVAAAVSGRTPLSVSFVLQPTVTYAAGVGTVAAVATLAIPAPGPGSPANTELEQLFTGVAGWLLATYAPGTHAWADVAAALGAGSDPPPDSFAPGLEAFLGGAFTFTLSGVDGTQPPPQNAPSAAVFPMPPQLQMQWTGGGAPLAFASRTTPADYAQVVSDYFAQLSIQGLVSSDGPGNGPGMEGAADPTPPPGPSLTEFLFTDWFLTVARQMARELADGGGTEGMPDAALATNVGGMVSRFMLNGLRLPDPATVPPDLQDVDLATLAIAPGYALSGQQFAVPDPTAACEATLTLAPGGGPLSIAFASGSSAVATLPVETAPPAPSPFATGAATVSALPSVTSQPLWFAQRTRMPWVSPAGTTFVVPLPPGVLQAVAGAPAALSVTATPPATSAAAAAAVDAAPALTLVSRVARVPVARTGQVEDGAAAPTFVPNVYQVLGTDDETRARVEALLKAPAAALSGAVLTVLYNAATTGYQSDAPFAARPVLLAKTNLSTTTQPATANDAFLFRALAAPDPLGPTQALLSEVPDFLRLLWEVSVVHAGGFYLQYADAQGSGLPDHVFTGDTADLTFLVTFPPASAAPVASPWHNALTVGQPGQGSLFIAVMDGSGGQLTTWSPSYPAGCIGFALEWGEQVQRLTSTAPRALYQDDWVDHLYHLVQFRVAGVRNQFTESLWSSALSPSMDSGGD
ncbi:MAG TPA: hypothetical protein VF665_08760, partial [Longimicrobium sp.]|uniref:hypothetical protein n=1 Tax=Longimicrobium sp. TaxID=2029185 RepID=UPI002ED9AC36